MEMGAYYKIQFPKGGLIREEGGLKERGLKREGGRA